MANDPKTLNRRIDSWGRSQRTNGATGLALILETGDKAFSPSGDWTGLARVMKQAEPVIRGRVKKVAKKAFGVSIVEDVKQPTGFRVVMPKDKGALGNGPERARLATLVQDKATLGGAAVGKWLEEGQPEPEKTPFRTRLAVSAVKALRDDKAKRADLVADLRAVANHLARLDEKTLSDEKAKALVALLTA